MKKQFIKYSTIILSLILTGCGGTESTLGTSATTSTTSQSSAMKKGATLSWAAPTTRSDGTPLPITEIGGYRIYQGSSLDNLVLVTDIANAYETEYMIQELSDGTHYFSVSTYNIENIESDLSEIVIKSI